MMALFLEESSFLYQLGQVVLFWLSFLAVYYVVMWVLLLAHEFGHAIASWLVGLPLVEMRLGRGRRSWVWRLGGADFHLHLVPYGGWVQHEASSARFFRLRTLVSVAGGPLASFAMVLLAFWSRSQAETWSSEMAREGSQLAVFISLGFLASSLWPASYHLYGRYVESDGLLLWRYLFLRNAEVTAAVAAGNVNRANRLFKSGHPEKALTLYREALASLAFQNDWKTQHALIWFVAENGHVDEAITGLRAVMDTPGNSDAEFAEKADVFACLVLYHGKTESLEEAAAVLRQAMARCPEVATLKGSMGGVLFELGRKEKALPLLQSLHAESKAPTDLGICAAYLAHYAQADGDREAAAAYAAEARQHLPAFLGAVRTFVERVLAGSALEAPPSTATPDRSLAPDSKS